MLNFDIIFLHFHIHLLKEVDFNRVSKIYGILQIPNKVQFLKLVR